MNEGQGLGEMLQSYHDSASVDAELRELVQSRSDFQLVHFVVQQHDTPHRQRYQVLRELQIMRGEIARSVLRLEQLRRDIERLETSHDPDRDLRIAEKRIDQAEIEIDVIGRQREFTTLLRIREALPRYTYEEFQALEPEYWSKWLSRRLHQKQFATVNGVDAGQIEAIEWASQEELLPGVGRIEPEEDKRRLTAEAQRSSEITEQSKAISSAPAVSQRSLCLCGEASSSAVEE